MRSGDHKPKRSATGSAAKRGGDRANGPVFNPATGEQSGEVAFASVEEIDRRSRLRSCVHRLAYLSLSKRADLFFRIYHLFDQHREDLARLLTRSTGRCSLTRSARCSAGSR